MELKNLFAQDRAGNALPSAICYLYERGSQTIVSGLLKANGVELSNPFLADENGCIQLSAPNGIYELKVQSDKRNYRIPVQFNDVTDTLNAAEAAALRAETARDTAQLLSGLKPDVAAGLVATPNGGYFTTPSEDKYESITYYRNNNGTAEKVTSAPNAEATRRADETAQAAYELALPRMLSQLFGWGVFGEDLNAILGVRRDGVAHAILDRLPGLCLIGDYAWAIVDKNHLVMLGMKWSGEMILQGFPWNPMLSAPVTYVDGPVGAQDVWILVEGNPYQITSGGDNFSPTFADGKIQYIQRSGGVSQKESSVPVSGSIAPFVKRILHFLSFGQSLSTGFGGAPGTLQPPTANRLLTIQDGVKLTDQDGTLLSSAVAPFKPLVTKGHEVPVVQQAAQVLRNRGLPQDAGVIATSHGRVGNAISALSKGTLYYNNLLTAVSASKAECDRLGLAYSVPFVDWIQGESDRTSATGVYFGKLLQLQQDLEGDINTAAVQTGRVPLLLDQISNWTAWGDLTSNVPLEQLQAALLYPDRFVCAGPKYWVETVADGIHLNTLSSMRVGAMHARAAEAIVNGNSWLPTHCVLAKRDGTEVTLDFHTPDGQLVVDIKAVSDPGNWGLRWIDSTASASIQSVRLSGANRVVVTLDAVPTGADPQIGIADIGISNAHGGPTTGARSCLRDSSKDVDAYGSALYNWACHQRIEVITVQ